LLPGLLSGETNEKWRTQPGSKLPGQKREQAPALHTHQKNSPIAIHHHPSFMTQAQPIGQLHQNSGQSGSIHLYPKPAFVGIVVRSLFKFEDRFCNAALLCAE